MRHRKNTMTTKGPGSHRGPSLCRKVIIIRECGDATIRRSAMGSNAPKGLGWSGGRTPRPAASRVVKALPWLKIEGVARCIPACSGPLPGRSKDSSLRAGRGGGRAAGGTARIRRRPQRRIRAIGGGIRFVRWPHGSGWRRRESGELGDGVGDSPTLARGGCAAVYAASAFRVVMKRIVPHLDITNHPATCPGGLGILPRVSGATGPTWENGASGIPRMIHSAAYGCFRLPEGRVPPASKRPGQRLDDLVSAAHPAGFEPATVGLEVRCSIQLS